MAVSLSEFASFIGVSTTDSLYSQAQSVLDATVEIVESKVGARGSSSSFAVYPSGRCLVLPVSRVTSVEEITDPSGVLVSVSSCDVDLRAGVVRLPFVTRAAHQSAYTVEVTTTASDAVDEATLIIGRHLWQSRRGDQGAAASAFAQDVPVVPVGFAIPRRAAELLAPLAAPGVA